MDSPVADSIKKIFKAPIVNLSRGQYEYYQFNQQAQTGQPIVVKMRPNGDIMEVTFAGFGRPLRNPMRELRRDASPVLVRPLA